jgi:hypothetical protein
MSRPKTDPVEKAFDLWRGLSDAGRELFNAQIKGFEAYRDGLTEKTTTPRKHSKKAAQPPEVA